MSLLSLFVWSVLLGLFCPWCDFAVQLLAVTFQIPLLEFLRRHVQRINGFEEVEDPLRGPDRLHDYLCSIHLISVLSLFVSFVSLMKSRAAPVAGLPRTSPRDSQAKEMFHRVKGVKGGRPVRAARLNVRI
jgi:hypothetical protein